MLADDQIRLLLAGYSGKDFGNRRDAAIIRLFLDTGTRLEGMGGLRYKLGRSRTLRRGSQVPGGPHHR